MIEYFKNYFDAIAKEYNGIYYVSEERVAGIDGSYLPLSKHIIKIPNGKNDIIFNIDFGSTAFASVISKIENDFESKAFKLKKRSPYSFLFNNKRKSLRVETKNEKIKLQIEELLINSGLENIARNTLFEPIIKFTRSGQDSNLEMMFSMAFEDKEKAIRPIIEFLKRLKDHI